MYPQQMRVDMKTCNYGIPIIGLVVAISISICIFEISKKIRNKYLVFIGINSMSIMYIHQFIHLFIAKKITDSMLLVFFITIVFSLLYCISLKKTALLISSKG